MIDIGYSGAWFTWSNHHPLNNLIQERINQVFINAEWNFLYPDASVQHFERAHFDHCPFYYTWTRIMMLNCLGLLDSNLCGYTILHFRVSSEKLGSALLVYLVQLPILRIKWKSGIIIYLEISSNVRRDYLLDSGYSNSPFHLPKQLSGVRKAAKIGISWHLQN